MHLPPPGTQPFLPSLLSHIRTAAPGFPLEPVIVQVLLLCIISGDRNLILRTREEDLTLVSKLTTLALNTIFGYSVHRLKCHSNSANQTPSDFLRSLFLTVSSDLPTDSNGNGNGNGLHRHRHRREVSVGKLSIAPSVSMGSTARSRRTSVSHSNSHLSESKPTPTQSQPDLEEADPISTPNAEAQPQRPSFHPLSARTDGSVPTIPSGAKILLRNPSRGSSDALRLPAVVVVSSLELASLPAQKAVLRTLAERKIIVSDGGLFGHDQDGLTLELPEGFFMVYVCRSDPRERPLIHKSLLDRFAMSSSVDVGPQTRLAMRQYRPPSSPSTTLSSPHMSTTSAACPTPHSLAPSAGPATPPHLLVSPVVPSVFIQQLKHLCTSQVHMRPPLNIYLADLFSATRHYGPLDGMMLTVRARQDAEALVRANRVLGADGTGAELIIEDAERTRETASVSTYLYSHPSVASTSSDGLVDGLDGPDVYETLGSSSVRHSLASQSEKPIKLDISEADIARMFPRVVSHRIRVRDSPFEEILSGAVCGAVDMPGDGIHDEELVEWERETVKDILVRILADV